MIPRIDYSRSRGLAKSAEVHMFNAFFFYLKMSQSLNNKTTVNSL